MQNQRLYYKNKISDEIIDTTQHYKKNHYNMSTGIDFISDQTQLGKYSEFKVYDMTRNGLIEHIIYYLYICADHSRRADKL